MPQSKTLCCISGCSNSRENAPDLKFYKFPALNANHLWKNLKRQQWISAVRKHVKGGSSNWEPKKSTIICSAHFIGGAKSEYPLNPAYLPRIFPREIELLSIEIEVPSTNFSISSLRTDSRAEKISKEQEGPQTKEIKEENDAEESSTLEETVLKSELKMDVGEEVVIKEEMVIKEELVEMEENLASSKEIMSAKETSILKEILQRAKLQTNIQEELMELVEHIDPQKKTETIGCQTFFPNVTSFFGSNCFLCNLKTENGVNNAELQVNIITLSDQGTQCNIGTDRLLDDLRNNEKCIGFHGVKSIDNDAGLIDLCGVSFAVFNILTEFLGHVTGNKTSNRDKLLIFLMKLKLGISYSALSILFGVHRTTISRTFLSVLERLNKTLSDYVSWISKEKVKETFSLSFRSRYPNCRVILDCSEIIIEAPPSIEKRVATYSNLESAFTVKFLLGCAPNGLVTFVSKCYDGRSDDNYIVKDCGILDLIESGDVVLVNKGLSSTKSDIENRHATFATPPFLTESEISPSEMESTYRNASVRIQVQRCIEKVKMFNILSLLPVELLPRVDAIVHVCCALLNMQKQQTKNE